MEDQFILYSYFRSSASYRVRIALHYKKLPFKYVPIHLIKDGGEQYREEYKKLNPQSQVPCLVHHGRPLAQSMAIIQYLEDVCHEPSLFPSIPYDKALVIQICEAFNSGLQPFQNLPVLGELEKNWGATPERKAEWVHRWNNTGLASVETLLQKTAGDFAFGDKVTAADLFLVPHVFSLKRFNFDMSKFPTIQRVNTHALELEAFQLAEPSRQPDYAP